MLFSRALRSATPLGPTGAVRFDVRVLWSGKGLSVVRLDVGGPEAGATRALGRPPRTGDGGAVRITNLPRTVPCLALDYQIAQKLHAVSDPIEPNDRFRDLIDVLLLDGHGGSTRDVELRRVCAEAFESRRRHPWPCLVTVRPGWAEGFRMLATTLGLPTTDVAEAIETVHAIVARIDLAAAS